MSKDNWINERMRKLLADDFCPKCTKHRMLHDDKSCSMRFVIEDDLPSDPAVRAQAEARYGAFEEDTCASSVSLSAPLEQWLP